MKAKKENKVYRVDESNKEYYLQQGYDIYNDEGELIENSPLSKISVNEHKEIVAKKDAAIAELQAEIAELQAEIAKLQTEIAKLQTEIIKLEKNQEEKSLSKMRVDELKVKAAELEIELPEGATADEIRKLIKAKQE